jgi:putative flippase GtrA
MTLPAIRESIQEKLRTPLGRKLFRYSMASVVAVVVSNLSLLLFVGVLRMGVVLASTLATTVATVPSYQMNRKWAWGKSGKSHLLKEVVPFWGLAVIGWAFSTYSVYLVDNLAQAHHLSHVARTATVVLTYFFAYGVLWVGKFVIFNKLMFVHRHHGEDRLDEPAAA